MSDTSASHPIFDELSDLARTLGHTHRLVLLHHVSAGEKAVEQLVELSGLSVANASQHLQYLKRAGLVETRREGKRVFYRLGGGPVELAIAALRRVAEHRRSQIRDLIDDTFNRSEMLDNILLDELVRRLREDAVVLLDVRPEVEYATGHLPQAINIPVTELEHRLSELPRDRTIVAYCRGVHCILSAEALAILQAGGWSARRFLNGLPDWQAAGFEIEHGHYESG